MTTHLTDRCGPHCGIQSTPSLAEKGHTAIVRHCTNCHEEYDFRMKDRPAHGPRRAHYG